MAGVNRFCALDGVVPSPRAPRPGPPPCSELDGLKGSKRRDVAKAALHALARVRTLTAERDTYVRAQPAAEHTRVRAGRGPRSGAGHRGGPPGRQCLVAACEMAGLPRSLRQCRGCARRRAHPHPRVSAGCEGGAAARQRPEPAQRRPHPADSQAVPRRLCKGERGGSMRCALCGTGTHVVHRPGWAGGVRSAGSARSGPYHVRAGLPAKHAASQIGGTPPGSLLLAFFGSRSLPSLRAPPCAGALQHGAGSRRLPAVKRHRPHHACGGGLSGGSRPGTALLADLGSARDSKVTAAVLGWGANSAAA